MFQKGHPGGPGRPKGSVDRTWANVKYWFDLLETELNKTVEVKIRDRDGKVVRIDIQPAVDSNTKAKIYMDAIKMLVGKMTNLPKDPADSVNNAREKFLEFMQQQKIQLEQKPADGDSKIQST